MAVPPEVMQQMAPPPAAPVHPKRNRNQMTDEEFQSVISAAVEDALSTSEAEQEPSRAAAIAAYHGAPYGDEEEGRSKYVSRDVHDTVMGQLPDIVRILLGPEQPCVFVAQTPQDEQWVDTATRYVDQVVTRQNDGFSVLYSAVKDALLLRKGIVKYWWDDSTSVSTVRYSALTEADIQLLLQDNALELIEKEPAEQAQQPGLFDVAFRRTVKTGRVKLCSIPPEDFIVDSGATDLDNFTFLGHRDSSATVAKLVAMGYDRDQVLEHAGSDKDNGQLTDALDAERRQGLSTFEPMLSDEGSRPVTYIEAFVRIDFDGDGLAELRRVCLMGPGYEVVANDMVADHPFAALEVDPEPHAFYGESTADKVMDIQRLKTLVIRNVMDSLAQSVHPRTAAIEGQVNMDDLLNNEVGSVVRVRQAGALQDLSTPFTGGAAMPVIDLLDTVREMRTGVSRQSLGLSSDSLQSTTKLAVEQSVSGSQGKIELIARVMANGLRRLYGGILRLLIENQDHAAWMQLAGRLVPVDPRAWNAEVGVKVNVALGSGTQEQRAAALQAIIAKQEQILQLMGMNQPLVTPAQYGAALRKLTEMSGWRNPELFFAEVSPDWKPQEPPPRPDPNQLAMQVQQAQIAAQVQVEQIRAQNRLEVAKMEDARERDKNISDAILKNKQLEFQFNASREQSAVRAASGIEQANIRRDTAREQMAHHAQEAAADRFNNQVANILGTDTTGE